MVACLRLTGKGELVMPIGKIISVPLGDSQYARVRDEYGSEYTVHASELPREADLDDDFAYKVDIWQNPSGNVTTLKKS